MIKQTVGLTGRIEKLYRTMLTRTRWHLTDLADSVGFDPLDTDDMITDLRSHGLVMDSADDPDAFRAVEPSLALPALAHQYLQDGNYEQVPAASSVEHFVALHETTDTRLVDEPQFGSVDQVTVTVERIAAHARKEVVMMAPEYVPGSFEFSRQIVETIVRRGVQLRMLWSRRLLADPAGVEHARWLRQLGVKLRIAPAVPRRLLIVDGSAADLPTTDLQFRRSNPGVNVQALVDGVDQLWDSAVEPERLTPSAPEDCGHNRRSRILQLLAKGMTDDTIARRIGVSVRTVRSEVASTMSCLDAQSRFQAGVMAAQMGLI